MKTLQQTLVESILDADFDITEDDIQPLKQFCQDHQAMWGRPMLAGQNINGEFLDIILTYNYGVMMGGVDEVDWEPLLTDIAKTGDSLMSWQPNVNLIEIYTCDRPRRGKNSLRWTLHTQNPRIKGASWEGPTEPNYRDEGIISAPWNNIKSMAGKRTKVIRLNGRKALNEILAGLKGSK